MWTLAAIFPLKFKFCGGVEQKELILMLIVAQKFLLCAYNYKCLLIILQIAEYDLMLMP